MTLGRRRRLAISAVACLAASCGSGDDEIDAQCLLTVDEAAGASGLSVTSAKSSNQEASGNGPACLYTDEDGNRLNLSWRVSTKEKIANTRRLQAENAAFFEARGDLANGAFVGANGIPSVFVPTQADHLIVVEMLNGLEMKAAAAVLAAAAAAHCCP